MRRLTVSPIAKPAIAVLLVALGLFGLQQAQVVGGKRSSHAVGPGYGYGYGYSYREAANRITVAAGPSGGPHVKAVTVAYGATTANFFAYTSDFKGGVNVARGDVDGDGSDDIITGAGPGGGPHVKVFKPDGTPTNTSFFPYSTDFAGGVRVVAADLTGDGKAEIITAAGPGGGPHIRVYNGDGTPTNTSFFAYGTDFAGGVNIAAGDIDGDDRVEIITGAGPGGGPHVKAFEANGAATTTSFFPYGTTFSGGVFVGRGDLDGAGVDEIITGAGPGGGPHVKAYRGDNSATSTSFFAFGSDFTGGVNVAGADLGLDGGPVEILAGAGAGGGPHVKVFSANGTARDDGFYAFATTFVGGVQVAGGDV